MGRWIGPVSVTVALIAALLMPLRASLAWGPEGHRAIALIALQRSDPGTRAKIQAILETDKTNRLTKTDIGSEATWADVLREKSEEARNATAAWHSTRFKPDVPDLARACFGRKPLPVGYPASHGPRENCSVDKINQFASELKNPETSSFEKLAALQFLLNLVGDLHDPLHAIDRGDQGGECVAVGVGSGAPARLANYWGGTLVGEVVGPDAARGATRIAASVGTAETQKWAEGTPDSWALETFEVARSVTYGFTAGQPQGKYTFPPGKGEVPGCASVDLYRVGPDYETKALAAVKTQIAKAGLRLARVLRDSLK